MSYQIEEAGGKRRCHNQGCTNTIAVGERCLTFRHGGGSYAVQKNLCNDCVQRFASEMSFALTVKKHTGGGR